MSRPSPEGKSCHGRGAAISRGQVVKRTLVREVEQHIRRALRTLASPTTPAEQEEIDGFCKVLGLGDDWIHATLKPLP